MMKKSKTKVAEESFYIIYFPGSDPGLEYEIVSGKQVVPIKDEVVKVGSTVLIRANCLKVRGEIVDISDDKTSLEAKLRFIGSKHLELVIRQRDRYRIKYEVMKSRYNAIGTLESYGECSHPSQLSPPISEEENNMSLLDKKARRQMGCSPEKKREKREEAKSLIEAVSSPLLSPSTSEEDKENIEIIDRMVILGKNKTKVDISVYKTIDWQDYKKATRKLLMAVFPREILATHSLTGKPSPAFLTRKTEKKSSLDPGVTSDIIDVVSKKCQVPMSIVRGVITTKCADENKLLKKRKRK